MHFSHKQHAAWKLKCRYCHESAETGVHAGFPAAAKCMTCHSAVKTDSPEIKRLAALSADAKAFPTHRVYEVPDFVVFSHARHRQAAVACSTCHGPVMEREVITREVPTTMKACVDCHRSRHASIACNMCHELSQ